MSRALVTGASGFIGRHTLEPLVARGYDVHAVRPPSSARGGSDLPADASVTWHETDLLDHDAARQLLDRVRPDRLLHLAWTVEHGRFWTDPRNESWVTASLAFIIDFGARGGRHVVVSGTCAEYDWSHLGDGRCVEGWTPVGPKTPYGGAKQRLHEALLESKALRAVRIAWGRLFQPYGPGENPGRFVPSVARALLAGEIAPTGSDCRVRDFLDVRDVAAALVALLDSGVGGAVNVASGQPTMIGDVVTMLGELTGRPDLVRCGALPDRPDDPPVLIADVHRLIKEVGFRPSRDLRAGLADAVEWWRRHMTEPA